MNIFTILPQYSGDSIIETSNQLRNSKKKLKRLEEKNGDSKEIKKLNILINDMAKGGAERIVLNLVNQFVKKLVIPVKILTIPTKIQRCHRGDTLQKVANVSS